MDSEDVEEKRLFHVLERLGQRWPVSLEDVFSSKFPASRYVREVATRYSTTAAVHSVKITPAMKQSVFIKGQAYFALDKEKLEARYFGEPENMLHNRPAADKISKEKTRVTYEITGKIEEPKAPYKVTEETKDILDDIRAVPEAEISTAGGKVARAPSGVRTRAVGISTEARKTGRIDLRGQKVKTAEDVAVLAQVYRDPRLETFRIFYLKDGVIVAHEGITSRMPASAAVFSKRPKFDLYKLKDRMKLLGADSITGIRLSCETMISSWFGHRFTISTR